MPNIDDNSKQQAQISINRYYRYRNNEKYEPEVFKSNRIICRDECVRDYTYFKCGHTYCNTYEIKDILLNDNFGLPEIKKEVKDIECRLDNPHFGLCKIKKRIKDIECQIKNPEHGLEEIKREVAAIEGAVFNQYFGLEEIKKEIIEILESINGKANECSTKTTGPVLADNQADRIVMKIFNNTGTPKIVGVTVYALTSCSKTPVFSTGAVTVAASGTREFISGIVPANYEVEFTGLISGVYGFTTTRRCGCTVELISANTFRHSELVPLHYS